MKSRIRVALPSAAFKEAVKASSLHLHDSADETDVDFVLRSFDSALPYLASIGSEAQWGTIPFTSRQATVRSFAQYIEESHRLDQSPNAELDACEDWKQMDIHEILDESQSDSKWRRVAAMGISTAVPDYVTPAILSTKARQEENFIYLNYLISDRRAGSLARHTASKLVDHAKKQAGLIGKSIIYVDCWRGNKDGLVSYYEKLGFLRLAPFSVPGKHEPSLPWDGWLLKMTLDQ